MATLGQRLAEQRAKEAGLPWPPKVEAPVPAWIGRMRDGKLPAKVSNPAAIPIYAVGEDRHQA